VVLFLKCVKKKGDGTVLAVIQKNETPHPWVLEADSKTAASLQGHGSALTAWSSCAPSQQGSRSELQTWTHTACSFSLEELSSLQLSSYSSAQYVMSLLNSSRITYRVSFKLYFTFREKQTSSFLLL